MEEENIERRKICVNKDAAWDTGSVGNLNCVPLRQKRGHILQTKFHPGSQFGLFYINDVPKLYSSDLTERSQFVGREMKPGFPCSSG